MRPKFIAALALLLNGVVAASVAAATTWQIPGDASGVCTPAQPSCDTLQAAITAAAAGDTITLAADGFTDSEVHVTKSVTITGAGPGNTVLSPTGVALHIEADDVTVRDLTIRGGTDGIRLGPIAPAIAGTRIENLEIRECSSDGIDVGQTTVTDFEIRNSTFRLCNNGIRLSSRSVVDGLTIASSVFEDHLTIGFYQANDGNTSRLSNFTLEDSTFRRNPLAAVYVEEIQSSTISGNDFTNNTRGLYFAKYYPNSGFTMGDITIRDNDFLDTQIGSIYVYIYASGLSAPIDIDANRFVGDVGVLTFDAAAIDIRLRHSFTHAPVRVTDNRLAWSGSFGVATSAYGVAVRGNGPVEISGNVLDGGAVGGSATPPSAGIYVRTTDATLGNLPSTTDIRIDCNRIFGFEHGVTVFDPTNGVAGGLPLGAVVSLANNSLTANALAGVVNGAVPPSVQATGNWWGCVAGPGNLGCDAAVGDVDASLPLSAAAACVPCIDDGECDDGNLCTQDMCSASIGCTNTAAPRADDACFVADAAAVKWMKKDRASGSQLSWKWEGEEAIDVAAFGTPGATTDYTLCVYDALAGETSVATRLALPAATPGWRDLPAGGMRYMDRQGAVHGIKSLRLKTAPRGGTTLALRARGEALPLPEPASVDRYVEQDPALTVQLVNSNGTCWSSTLTPAGTKVNTSTHFAAGTTE